MEIIAAAAVASLAALVRGATGFGFALIATPILSLLWVPEVAVPVVLILEVAITPLLYQDGALAGMRWREPLLLCGFGFLGAVGGVMLAARLDPSAATIGLNIAVLISAAAALLNLHGRFLDRPAIAALFAIATGALVGAFAVGGTLLLAWMLAVRRTPAEIRGTLTLLFGVTDLSALLLRVALGTFPFEAAKLSLLLTPVIVLGVYAGSHLFRRADARAWRRSVAVLLVFVALFGLGRTSGLM